MSTQYNSIRAPYDELRTRSLASIESANVHSAIAPFINGANTLELACGSGFYSYDLLKWGASNVVAVDISPAMIRQARVADRDRKPANSSGGSIQFLVADASIPVVYEKGPFDLVFAGWFLNYAPTAQKLVDMFTNVALNIKDGGHFITICPPPTQNPAVYQRAERKVRPQGSDGLLCNITEFLEDGIKYHVYVHTERGDVNFDCYHLRQDVYEASARKAGFRGELKWSVTEVPDEILKSRKVGASVEELESYKIVPRYGVLDIVK